MRKFEYIRLSFDFGDLSDMNGLGGAGWRVVSIQPSGPFTFFALMEREITALNGGTE